MKHKNPAFMYYPKDWRADRVFGCSISARGLWHEMMGLMHESPRYGYLCDQKGEPIPSGQVARMCGVEAAEYELLLAELLAAGVPRESSGKILYSKRMVEDEKQRKEWRNKKQNQRTTRKDVPVDVPEMSNVSAFPSSYSNEVKEKNNTAPAALDGLVPIELWAAFVTHRHKLRKPLTPHAVDLILHKLQVLKSQGHDPISLLDTAIERGWLTVFAPDGGGNGRTGSTQNGTDARKERAEQKHQDTQQVIASVLGHGSRLAERLRENLPK